MEYWRSTTEFLDPGAFIIIMNVIHGRNYSLPKCHGLTVLKTQGGQERQEGVN
jgi:hypothetical protein